MPSKQTFCWCFGGRPPDIKYGIDGDTQLKSMALDIPMPTDENELNAMFEELVAELDLDKPHRDALFNLQPEKKWQIYCSKKQVYFVKILVFFKVLSYVFNLLSKE
ncbi:disheveled-associated activator of morphogenesis 1-A-like [Mercenaria mercenaria]|uniref:disheveled-associated activator of morphogenesis 1-A-like n=1 Tax=Mercenaria mercenaria TaxID=6596 RepID=UPI00234F36B8|nr:disheveled-associated activator of morphogenesis 1-A-like [Mercenaria mercenaria]XP_053407282.1 disheveled-associated activator of morphogenesis 1-A-like [Mercenaria mercenaria]XP_053407287.1 disheveled-associated activator of morphogenesis 1-A-like [Mercenaria mercenaria]XP_053407290.1 disheveled-associated activator of morphogenesis 1-A-like [Mercenaria mercenaria]XP_053407294.1 disheveled-associated activator of morphogenesis 1-A-like [Mercenaria mercenaria]